MTDHERRIREALEKASEFSDADLRALLADLDRLRDNLDAMRAALHPAALPELPKPTKAGHLIASCPVYQDIEVKRFQREAFEAGRADTIAALQSQPAAAGVSDADLYGTLEPTIVSRYVVEKRVGGGFWGYCVKAGDGAQEIFVGHKNACEHVRQALQTACLDGAYMAHEKARAILALRPQAVPTLDLEAACIGYARLDGNEYKLASMRRNPVMDDGQLHPIYTFSDEVAEAHHGITAQGAQGEQA